MPEIACRGSIDSHGLYRHSDFRDSPLDALGSLWNGQLPETESEADAQALVDGLVPGLWGPLAGHQNSRQPFMLVRTPVTADRTALQALAVSRQADS